MVEIEVQRENDSKKAVPISEAPTRESVERDLQYLSMIIGMFETAKEHEWKAGDSNKLATACADVIKTFRCCAQSTDNKKWIKNTNQRILELKKQAVNALENRKQLVANIK